MYKNRRKYVKNKNEILIPGREREFNKLIVSLEKDRDNKK